MNKAKAKYAKIAPNYLKHIVSPIKADQTYSIQFQEPMNDKMMPIKSSTGFAALHDDYYISELNSPNQVEIANDKAQNNEEIIVNNQVHEKVIDQNYNKEDQFDRLLNQNDINHLDFISTLLRLQNPKPGKVVLRNDDESKNDIKEIIDLCEEHNSNKRVLTNDRGFTNNITGNCNLDSFLNDITPRKNGFEPQMYSAEKKGLSMKDLIEITNKRKKHLSASNTKGTSGVVVNKEHDIRLHQSRRIIKTNQGDINQSKAYRHHNSTKSVRYDEESNHQNQSISINECGDNSHYIIANTSESNLIQNQNQSKIGVISSSQDNQKTKGDTIVKDTYDKGINTSNLFIEQNGFEIEPFPIMSIQNNNISPMKQSLSSNAIANRYMSNRSATFELEGTKIFSSNPINKNELCNTIPHVQYQSDSNKKNLKVPTKGPNLILKPHIPISTQQQKPYSYGAFNVEINNRIYFPNCNTYTKSNSNNSNKHIKSIKPIERSSFNDFVNYGSNPLAGKPEELRPKQNESNNESLSIIPLNPDSQINDDCYKIEMAEIDSTSLKPKSSVMFSIEQSTYHNYNKDQLNNYKTNISLGSSKEEEDEPSQVHEYDIEKNKHQNESREMKFSQNQIHSSNANANISSVNLSKLTNFADIQSKKYFSTSSKIIESNPQSLIEKKDLVRAEIDLFADDHSEEEGGEGGKDKKEERPIANHHCSKEQPSPYTQELKKKMNYFDESSLIGKGNGYSTLKHSIVESIKEKPIEYDIDELVNPQYLLKNSQLANNCSLKKHLSKSFCGVDSSKPTQTSNRNTAITRTNTSKNHRRNLSRTNSSIEKNQANLCLMEKKGMSKSIQSNISIRANEHKDQTPKRNNNKKKYIAKDTNLQSSKAAKSSTKSKDNLQEKHQYKFEPKKIPKNSFSEGMIQIKNEQNNDPQLNICPCDKDKVEIQKQMDLTKSSTSTKGIPSQFTSPAQDNKAKYDLDAFSIEVPNTHSSKKPEYSNCVNDLVTDSLRMQRQTQEKSRKKILENLAQIVISQEKNEKELKDKLLNMKLNESQMGESASSFADKLECEKELAQVSNDNCY